MALDRRGVDTGAEAGDARETGEREKKKRGDCRRVPLGTRSFLHAVPTLIGPRLGRTANWAEALPLRLFF